MQTTKHEKQWYHPSNRICKEKGLSDFVFHLSSLWCKKERDFVLITRLGQSYEKMADNQNNNNNIIIIKFFYSKHSKSNNIGCDYTDRNENRTEILRGYSEHYRVPII